MKPKTDAYRRQQASIGADPHGFHMAGEKDDLYDLADRYGAERFALAS